MRTTSAEPSDVENWRRTDYRSRPVHAGSRPGSGESIIEVDGEPRGATGAHHFVVSPASHSEATTKGCLLSGEREQHHVDVVEDQTIRLEWKTVRTFQPGVWSVL